MEGMNIISFIFLVCGGADVRDLKEKESFSIEQDFAIDPVLSALVSFRQTIRSLDHITRTLSDHFSIQPI
jgi:hypothetical protein